MLEAERHDVHAADPGDLSNLLDGLHAQLNALGGDFVALNAAEPSLDVVGHVDAGNTRAHELQDSQRPDRPHPGEDAAVLSDAELAHVGHPASEQPDIEDVLGLHELCTRRHFLRESSRAERGRRRERILDRADQPARRLRQGLAGHEPAVVTQRSRDPRELNAIQVEHELRLRVVAKARMIAGEQQDIGNAECSRGQQVRLKRYPVPVATGELHDWFNPGPLDQQAPRKARQAHLGALVVGNVRRVYPAAQKRGLTHNEIRVGIARRPDLGGDRELPGTQDGAQISCWRQSVGHRDAALGCGVRAGRPAGAAMSAHRPSSRPCQ